MLTFSLNVMEQSGSLDFAHQVALCIQRNMGYFRKYGGVESEEYAARAYLHTIEHRKDGFVALDPYIKRLAQTLPRDRRRSMEVPYATSTDGGEVAVTYHNLLTSSNHNLLFEGMEVRHRVEDLFLEYPAEMRLIARPVLRGDIADCFVKPKNKKFIERCRALYQEYDSTVVYSVLRSFFERIKSINFNEEQTDESILVVNFKTADHKSLEKIPTKPTIRSGNKTYGVDSYTLLTEDVDPDFIAWEPIQGVKKVCKIDISPLFTWVYDRLHVAQGVNNVVVTWAGSRYRLTTPGGDTYLNLGFDRFLELVHKETVLNLLKVGVTGVLAISKDSLYTQFRTRHDYNIFRCKIYNGRTVDLPVEVYTP